MGISRQTSSTAATARRVPTLCVLLVVVALAAVLATGCGGRGGESGGQATGGGGGQPPRAANPLEHQNPLESNAGPDEKAPAPLEQEDPFGGAAEAASSETPPAGSADAAAAGPSEDVPDVSGAWTGTITDDTGTEGSLQISLQQEGSTLTGNGAVVTDSAGGKSISPLEGSIDDTGALELMYQHPENFEVLSIEGTVEGDSISGEATRTRPDEVAAEPQGATFFLNRAAAGG